MRISLICRLRPAYPHLSAAIITNEMQVTGDGRRSDVIARRSYRIDSITCREVAARPVRSINAEIVSCARPEVTNDSRQLVRWRRCPVEGLGKRAAVHVDAVVAAVEWHIVGGFGPG